MNTASVAAAVFNFTVTPSSVNPGVRTESTVARGHNGCSPWYQASPYGSWKQVKSPRWRSIHSNAVEVERGTAHSAMIFFMRLAATPTTAPAWSPAPSRGS